MKLSDIIYPELKTTGKLLFNYDNYLIWKPKILFVLADYKLDAVLTTSFESTPNWGWLKLDHSARVDHILPSLDAQLISEYENYSTAKSIMDSLEDRFNNCSGSAFSKKADLLGLYLDHKMQPNLHINKHIFRMLAMAKELEYAGINLPEKMQAVLLLNSVPEDWRAEIESVRLGSHGREEELSVDNAILLLRIANDSRKWKNYPNNPLKISCKNCGKEGHRKPDCPEEEGPMAQQGFLRLFKAKVKGAGYTGFYYLQIKTIDKLDYSGSTFFKWESILCNVLDKNEVKYVLTDPKPPEEDVYRRKKWLADDLLCRHLILGAVDNDIFLTFHDYPSAKALMDAIKAFFTFSSNARCMLVMKKYMDCRMSEGTCVVNNRSMNLSKLVTKLKRRAGMDIPNEVQAVVLMNSLPGSWNDTLRELKLDMDLNKKDVDFNTVRRRLVDVASSTLPPNLRELVTGPRPGR